jgi:hypothetical protein
MFERHGTDERTKKLMALMKMQMACEEPTFKLSSYKHRNMLRRPEKLECKNKSQRCHYSSQIGSSIEKSIRSGAKK